VFDILLLRSIQDCASSVSFHLSTLESADCSYVSLRDKCAAEVFKNPGTSWNASSMARRLRLPPAQLCQRLFAEGAALSEIIRKQRCINAFVSLLDTADSTDSVAAKTGFTGRRQMERAFQDMLMVDAQLLERPILEEYSSASDSARSELPARIFRIRP
jgi:AraC-like DNA-binding protein